MHTDIEDRNLSAIQPLVSPADLKRRWPASERCAATVMTARRAVRDVIHGRDRRRLVVVVGPCSIHDPQAALDYALRLRRLAATLEEELVVILRTYFEKPRTTVGWKGLINDPRLDGSCDVAAGLALARQLLLEINESGLPCGSEVLDPFTPQFLADLLAWGSIGARTAESQTHRELASGLSMPVGFKNGTDGDLAAARNGLIAAGRRHSFLGIAHTGESAVVRTRGNPDRHLILRGGRPGPNYGPAEVATAAEMIAPEKLRRPVMVDCSHGNSNKEHSRQGAVSRAVAAQVRAGSPALMGLMLESNLRPGQQAWRRGVPLLRGVSITDACIGWEETETLLGELAAAVRAAPERPRTGLRSRQVEGRSGCANGP